MSCVPCAIEATLVDELRFNVLLGRIINQVGEQLSLLRLAIVAQVLMHRSLESHSGTISLILRRVDNLLVNRATVAVHPMIDASFSRIVSRHTKVHVRVKLFGRYLTEVTILPSRLY